MTPSIAKPPYGAPCNRCGRCCTEEVCGLGQRIFERLTGPCPALECEDGGGRYRCGLIARPGHYAPDKAAQHGEAELAAAAYTLLAAGTGCDARSSSEPPLPAEPRRIEREAAAVWGYHTRSPAETEATITRVTAASEDAGRRALAEGLSIEERLALRHEQLSRRGYAGALRSALARQREMAA